MNILLCLYMFVYKMCYSLTTVSSMNMVIGRNPRLVWFLICDQALRGTRVRSSMRENMGVCRKVAEMAARRKYSTCNTTIHSMVSLSPVM